jgi:rfaE bifunctional protein nucleotidyltransferase chain/domain
MSETHTATSLRPWLTAYQDKVIAPEQLEEAVKSIKASGKTIVTLNGSFDLMHAGHLHILYEAAQLADVLIVALNSDSSIQQYKSPLRPIIPLTYRLQMMAAIGFVDYVTWFEETDPIKLLTLIQPHIHVNGANYGEECIEAATVRQYGGRLHLTSLVPGLSTTEIVAKIKHLD